MFGFLSLAYVMRTHLDMNRRLALTLVLLLGFVINGALPATVDAGSPSLRWGKRSITVYDYTSDMGTYVATKVAEWNVALAGNLTLSYQRMDPRQDCAGVNRRGGAIVVCNEVERGQNYSGLTTVLAKKNDKDRIESAKVALVANRYDGPHDQYGWPYGCHEIGHALGLNHIVSTGSCMNSDRDTPGADDVAMLQKMYGKKATKSDRRREAHKRRR